MHHDARCSPRYALANDGCTLAKIRIAARKCAKVGRVAHDTTGSAQALGLLVITVIPDEAPLHEHAEFCAWVDSQNNRTRSQ